MSLKTTSCVAHYAPAERAHSFEQSDWAGSLNFHDAMASDENKVAGYQGHGKLHLHTWPVGRV